MGIIQSLYRIAEANEVGRIRRLWIPEPGYFTYTLNFNCLRYAQTGRCITFDTNEDQPCWSIEFYPNGDCEENKNYVSVFIKLLSTTEIVVDAWILLKIIVGEKVFEWSSSNKHSFVDGTTSWGFHRLMKSDSLNRANRGLVTLMFEPYIVSKYSLTQAGCTIPADYRNDNMLRASLDFKELLDSKKFNDVTLVSSDDQEFQAHKAILAARSSYFAAHFGKEWSTDSQVRFDDVKAEVLEQLLLYLYTCQLGVGKLEVIGKELLAAADEYLIEDLKTICQEYFIEKVNFDNAMEHLLFADTHNAEQLKAKAISMIAKHSNSIVGPKDFKELNSRTDLMLDILKAASSLKNNV